MTKEQSCVQRILSKKLEPGQKPTDQDLAIEYSDCQEKKSAMSLQSLKIKFGSVQAAYSFIQPKLTASLDTQFGEDPSKQGMFASYFLVKGDDINGRE